MYVDIILVFILEIQNILKVVYWVNYLGLNFSTNNLDQVKETKFPVLSHFYSCRRGVILGQVKCGKGL